MKNISLQAATASDTQTILAMNDAVVEVTSPMDEQRLAAIVACGAMVQTANHDDAAAGFLITLPPQTAYDSSNYQWFDARFRNFLYIDRIVIDHRYRGTGIGAALYSAAIEQARENNMHWLAAEMDLNPPNKASLAFHRKQGFSTVGEQRLALGKLVSMQIRAID